MMLGERYSLKGISIAIAHLLTQSAREVFKDTHQEISHSATYSMPTITPNTLQYINHRSRSCSEAGRCESVLKDA